MYNEILLSDVAGQPDLREMAAKLKDALARVGHNDTNVSIYYDTDFLLIVRVKRPSSDTVIFRAFIDDEEGDLTYYVHVVPSDPDEESLLLDVTPLEPTTISFMGDEVPNLGDPSWMTKTFLDVLADPTKIDVQESKQVFRTKVRDQDHSRIKRLPRVSLKKPEKALVDVCKLVLESAVPLTRAQQILEDIPLGTLILNDLK